MTIEQIEAELVILYQRQRQLREELSRLKSADFIEKHKIRRNDVQLSKGDGIPWFDAVNAFRKWLADPNCPKRFCEWNGRLIRTADMIHGCGDLNSPGRFEDVPE